MESKLISTPFSEENSLIVKEFFERKGVCIYPTETFYAIGCRADCSESVLQIYELKKRDKTQPLLVLVNSWDLLFRYAEVPSSAKPLLEKYWPGALTAILPTKEGLAKELNFQGSKLAFRYTPHKIAQQLIEVAGVPLVGTSANFSKQPEIDQIEVAQKNFKDDVSLYIDGGKTQGGLPSTLIDFTTEPFQIVRQGIVNVSELQA
ncbi:MAG: L-threonylcarbamoyladenylate synthase [bacterium]|jgi:L-threonylcarbamoyladenylate synthase